jgi:hypothetical protein
VDFRISLTPRLSIFLMLFTLIFLVLVSLIGYELGYREGQRQESSEAVARPASESGEKSDTTVVQRP